MAETLIHLVTSTTQIWVGRRHQYGISALVFQAKFRCKTSGDAKCRLFSVANFLPGPGVVVSSTISSPALIMPSLNWPTLLKRFRTFSMKFFAT